MVAVSFSPKSRQDIIDIGDYIARDSQGSARRFVGRLIDQCQRIGKAPLAYTAREDLAPGLRMAPIGRYVVFFRVLGERVRVERVLLSLAFGWVYRSLCDGACHSARSMR